MSYWKHQARRAIEHALKESGAIGPDGKIMVSEKEVRRIIRGSSPKPRINHPYKMWLKEQRLVLCELGLEKPLARNSHTRKPRQDIGDVTPGQLNLFGIEIIRD